MPGDELVDAGAVNSEECAQSHLLPHGRRFLGKGIAEAIFLQLVEHDRNLNTGPAE
jgi:hypothetical protein